MADVALLVVERLEHQIFLRTQFDLLVAGGVVEQQHIVAAAAFARLGEQAGLSFVVGHGEVEIVVRIVDRTDHDRPVRIAFLVLDEHFVADARQKQSAASLASPILRDADAARAVRLAVPIEANFDAPLIVQVDLFARCPDHERGLRTLNDRFTGEAARAKLSRRVHQFVDPAVSAGLRLARDIALIGVFVPRSQDKIVCILRLSRVLNQRRFSARKQRGRRPRGGAAVVLSLLRLLAKQSQPLPNVLFFVASGPFEHFQGAVSVGGWLGVGPAQVGGGLLVIVVLQREHAGLQRAQGRPGIELLLFAPDFADFRQERNRRQPGNRLVRRSGVGEHQRVLLRGMLEVIVDPEFLHQPGHEIEIGLAILHRVFERGIASGGRVAKIGEAAVGEHFMDNVSRRQVGEDPAVRAA